jgi:hypothetical protein
MKQKHDKPSRRTFLKAGIGATLVAGGASLFDRKTLSAAESGGGELIRKIEQSLICNGRKTGVTWFHPRACFVPDAKGPYVLMTLQSISGSDNFGPVHWTTTKDGGVTWAKPEPIAGFERRAIEPEWEEGVCDVVPEYHPNTKTVLAVGHNVYYRNNKLARPQRSRWPMYAVQSADGRWSPGKRLQWDDPRGRCIYTCGCAQRLTLENGDVLIPLSFAAEEKQPRSVATVLCSFDGQTLTIRKVGNALSNPVQRGLLEPSLAYLDGRFYMTIRAEDDRGYVATSDDGLQWQPQKPWLWDDGEPVVLSSTQQRWLTHSDGLFLVYTRKTAANTGVMRWRAPLFVAAVDPRSLRLIRSSEKTVFPLIGDGIHDGKHIAGMGNFHTTTVSPTESWVTVGEELRNDGWKGDTLLARIQWSRPNRIGYSLP